MRKLKRITSIILATLLVVSMMTVMGVASASAAPADFSSETKTVFFTDSQNWDGSGTPYAYYWRVDTSYPAPDYNKVETVTAGDWVEMTYLYDNTMNQSVYGVVVPDDANWILFNVNSGSNGMQTTDTKNVYDGSWFYVDGNKDCQPCSGDVFETAEQTASLSAAFVDATGADGYYCLDGKYYYMNSGVITEYTPASDLLVAEVVGGANDGQQFTDVNAAVAAAGEGGEVKLIADIKSYVGIDGDYTTTLNLNSKKITNASGSAITLYSAYPGGKTFTIKGSGTVTSTKKYAGDACISDSSGRKVVIKGGTYNSDANALYISSDEGWTIDGGTFNGDIKVVSDLTVNKGTINGDINATGPSWKVDPASVTITGGTVNGDLNSENGSTFAVTGGTFTDDVSAYADFSAIVIEHTAPNGKTTYYTDASGLATLNDGTYKLLADVTRTQRMAYGLWAQDVTIDLNGFTLTSTATDCAFTLGRAGNSTTYKKFTLTDTSTNGGGKLVANSLANSGTSNTSSVFNATGNYNDITIKDVTIEATQGIALIGNNQKLTIDNSDITVTGTDFALATNGTKTGAVIEVTDSSLESTNGVAVYLPSCATATFTDTDVTGTTAMYIKSGNVTIDGGTYTGTGDAAAFTHNGNGANATGDAVVVENCNYPNGAPTVAITDGTFVSENAEAVASYAYGDSVEPVDEIISGGEFSSNVSDLVVADKKAADQGTDPDAPFVIVNKVYVAQIGSTGYETIGEAIAAAQDGDTIELLSDVNIGANWYRVNKDVTFDLGGFTVTGNDSFIVVGAGADVTIENGTVTSDVSGDYVLYADGNLTIADDATIVASAARGNAVIVRAGGQLDVEGTIQSGYYSVAAFGTATVNVENGASITSTDASALSGNGSGGNEGYTFNVKGGTLTSTNDVAIYHPNQGTLNITGGTITGATAIYIKSGTTDVSTSATSITGATITGNGAAAAMVHSGNGCNPTGDAIVIENCGYPGGVPNIDISGGTIASQNAQDVGSYGYDTYEPVEGFVSGGTFAHPVPVEQCAEGFKPEDNGNDTYGVTEKTLQEEADTALAAAALEGLEFVDGTHIGAASAAYKASLLGVQVREDAEYTAAQQNNDKPALRYIAAVDKTFLNGLDDYGFEITAMTSQGVKTFEYTCKGTDNDVIIDGEDSSMEYFTLGLLGITDTEKVFTVKFFVKKGNDTAYAKYTKSNPTDAHAIIASYDDVVLHP